MRGPYINASEINTFLFCKRAWHLEQNGAPSSLKAERAAGTVAHQHYGRLVQVSGRNGRLAICLALAAALLIAVVLALR